jgi:hypothetical protein
MVRAFLSATARGFKLAAAQPNLAADTLLEAVAADYVDNPLPGPAWVPDMVHESQVGVGGDGCGVGVGVDVGGCGCDWVTGCKWQMGDVTR